MHQGGGARRTATTIGAAGAIGLGMATGAQAADFTVETTADAGNGSLREKIGEANALDGADRILFASELSGEIELASPLPDITDKTEVVGPGADRLTIDGGGYYRPFTLYAETSISGLTLSGSGSTRKCGSESCFYTSGAAISIRGYHTIPPFAVTVANVVFEDNRAWLTSGGAIGGFNRDELTVTGSAFKRNDAYTQGGGIYFSGPLTVTDSNFVGNESGSGGAISTNSDDHISISASNFEGNHATYSGGAIAGGGPGDNVIRDSVFTQNSASGPGGAVATGSGPGGDSLITRSTFVGNQSILGGGALYAMSDGGPFTVSNSTFAANRTTNGSGGALNLNQGSNQNEAEFRLDSLTIVDNVATGSPDASFGGGIYQAHQRSVLTNSIITGNQATTGPDIGGGSPGTGQYGGDTFGRVRTAFSLVGDTGGDAFIDEVPGSNLIGLDPRLGQPADHGGTTETMAPALDSPVVNKGASSITSDQRGLKRPVLLKGIPLSKAPGANGADMGAVEVQGEEGPTEPILPPPEPPNTDTGPISAGRVTLNKKKGVATLPIKVPTAGRLVLAGSKAVVSQSKVAAQAGTIKVTVKARGKSAKKLKRRGWVKVRAAVRFTPASGTVKSLTRTIKLVKKKPKRRE